jgi:hypothetical protein
VNVLHEKGAGAGVGGGILVQALLATTQKEAGHVVVSYAVQGQ